MKNNNYTLFALGLLILMGCAHVKVEDTPGRNVASADKSNMCLESNFSTSTLQKEVAEYEKNVKAEPVQGFWRHINLEDLPIPQAKFLKKFGDSIGDQANPDSVNYEGCKTLPCIFNRIYQRDEFSIAGYVHYIWYLKFGSYLALDNMVPMQKSKTPGTYQAKEYNLTDYLFTNDELYGLWRITHMLEAPYTSLSNFNELQRTPGRSFTERKSLACGFADNDGNIVLAFNCLNVFDQYNNKERGDFYRTVIHEMTHLLDSMQAKKGRDFRSDENDFLEVAGYGSAEFTDVNGKVSRKWLKKKLPLKVSSRYATMSTAENFAETIALFRVAGERMKTSTYSQGSIDLKYYNWISKNYFHGETYDQLGNTTRLIKKYEDLFLKDISAKVAECSSKKLNLKSNYFTLNDFSKLNLSTQMLNCISYEAEVIAKKLTENVQMNDVDGCSTTIVPVWEEESNPWKPAVKEFLKNIFVKNL